MNSAAICAVAGFYESMLAWETDPSMRGNELRAAFADVWCAISNVVFSRTLDATEKHVSIGGASLAAATIELGLLEELRCSKRIDIDEEGNFVSLSCAALGIPGGRFLRSPNASGHSGVRQLEQ